MTTSVSAAHLLKTNALWGTVIAVQANFYSVRLAPLPGGAELPAGNLLCTRRGRLKKVGQQVMVGDRVQIEEPDWEGQRGAIIHVSPRRTQLDRPPVANADQILLVFAIAEPDLDPHQLTRFLVKAELTGLKISLCLNKCDLVDADTQLAWQQRLTDWGYRPQPISVQQKQGLVVLTDALRDRITVVSGPSGVGKSSLINTLIPAAQLRVSAVSGKLGRGRHTTRHVELFELPQSGLLADTPGFNQPDIACSPADLGSCFPEIRKRLQQQRCQFADCLHRGEPGCVISDSWERYDNYRQLLAECEAQVQVQKDSTTPDAAFKVKVTDAGQVQEEPRLQPKKYRRVSRRSRKQSLEDLRYEISEKLSDLDAVEDSDSWSGL
ncbi:MAG: small ribosomal subunit biogenesis GTPase RsgA [Cyanobacteria bacterium P01_D01_bin.71]